MQTNGTGKKVKWERQSLSLPQMDTRITAIERSLNRTNALIEGDFRQQLVAVETLMQQHGTDIEALHANAKRREQVVHSRIDKECSILKNHVATSVDNLQW